MSGKKSLILIIIFLVIQILFSFYYSNEILSQNSELNEYQTKYNILTTNNQQLLNEWTNLTSIKNIQTKIASQSYTLIQNSFDINSN